MSVEVKGTDKVLAQLQRKLSGPNLQKVSDDALKAGAKVFVKELKIQLETFRDTGATVDEVTISEPMTVRERRMIQVHWRGPKNRYRIIHLNEFGTIKNPTPRGKGKIAQALRNAESAYRRAIKQAIERGI